MFTSDFMRVVIGGYLADTSQPWINTWSFRCVTASDANALQNIGSYIVPSFIEFFYTPLLTHFSTYGHITSVSLREYGDIVGGYDWAGNITMGTASGNPLPAFVTYNVELKRDNYAFTNGRKGLPAVPTNRVDVNGRLDAGLKAGMNSIVADWNTQWNVEADAALYVFELCLVHNASDVRVVPAVYSNILSVNVKGFGTQNTRK